MAIPLRRLLFLLLSIVLLLILLHVLSMPDFSWSLPLLTRIHYRFDLDSEGNIPTWYSTVLLFAVSFCSLGISVLSYGHRHSQKFWLVFSCVYCYLSMDEAASFHEYFGNIFFFNWVFVYAPFALAFFVLCVYHLLKCGNKTLRHWILSGLIVYALGGMGCELIARLYRPLPPFLYKIEVIMEEGLEMTGSIIVLMGCLRELIRFWSLERNKKITA